MYCIENAIGSQLYLISIEKQTRNSQAYCIFLLHRHDPIAFWAIYFIQSVNDALEIIKSKNKMITVSYEHCIAIIFSG